MKKDNILLKGVIGGLGVGLCLFVLKKLGVDTSFVVPFLLGVLVIALDYICFRPVVFSLKNNKVLKYGEDTTATIGEIVNYAVHPKDMVRDAMGNLVMPPDTSNVPTMYAVKLTYNADGNEYITDHIIPQITQNEIYPYKIKEGEQLPIKYLKNDPCSILINIPSVISRVDESNDDFRHKGPFTAFVMTTIYVFYLIKRVF